MKDTKSKVIVALLVINLIITAGLIGYIAFGECAGPSLGGDKMNQTSKYTMYIGTNDKDTYAKVMPLDEARDIVNEICMEHVGGYTVQKAAGGWLDDKGIETTEESLVYTFCDVSEDEVTAILDDVIEALNQNSILVEHDNVTTYYYTR